MSVTGCGLLPLKRICAVSRCAVPATPRRRIVADHLPASAPEVIFVNVSATFDGVPYVPLSMSSVAAAPEK